MPPPIRLAIWVVAFLGLISTLPAQGPRSQPGRPTGTWVGQDGRDFVGPSSELGPSGVQDIHIRLTGLPVHAPIQLAVIRGHGGDEWQAFGPPGPWKAHLIQRPGSGMADLFLEPTRVETGRSFTINLTFEDGRTAELIMQGGRADPNLRMPGAQLSARWIGQDGRDRVGPGPSVGPDGIQDAVIELNGLSPEIAVKAVAIQTQEGVTWQSGMNPRGLPNADLVRRSDDPKRADVFLNPDRDRAGETFRVHLLYENDKRDRALVVAGQTDPGLRVSPPKLPKFLANEIQGRWLGQNGSKAAGPGTVEIALEGLPESEIVAAALTNSIGGHWLFKARPDLAFEVGSAPLPLVFDREGDRGRLAFAPIRDESGSSLVLRLLLADGRQTIATIPGGSADPGLRGGDGPPDSMVEAQPGDDLNALASRFGEVRLAAGTYRLRSPLVLERSVRIVGEAGAVLLFDQPADGPPWTSAIKVHDGRTSLEGFAVRFAGPIRWAKGISYGPAVIGTTDNHDQGSWPLKAGLLFRGLDLESPPPSTSWEEAIRLIRLANAENGRIERNILRGGTIEFFGGPWIIRENEYRGTHPGSYCFDVFSGHLTHDLQLIGNTAKPVAPSGKTWRFLVLTVRGARDQILENRIAGIGPHDDDKVHENAPEIILTEAYRLRFEGRPLAQSDDGLILAIPEPQGEAAEPGNMVASLNGPNAGTFYRVAQRIDRQTYLIDPATPLPAELGDISIATGFVDERFERNEIDARGGSRASGIVLVGNHYGTTLADNLVVGCGEALRLKSTPTEQPVHWGWSHSPVFGLRVESNRIEDSQRGAVLAVEHGPPVKSTAGRVYLSASLRDNRFSNSPLLTVGDPRSQDPAELVVSTQNQTLPGALNVHAATIDGRAIRAKRLTLPVAPGP